MKYEMLIERCSYIPQAKTCDTIETLYANTLEIAIYKFNKKVNTIKQNFEKKGLITSLTEIGENQFEMLVYSSKMNTQLYEILLTFKG